MFIQTEETRNPSKLKFLPGRQVLHAGSMKFEDAEVAKNSPLAERLFGVKSVEAVAFGTDHITLTKAEAAEWKTLKPAILGVIMDHFTAERPILADAGPENAEAEPAAEGAADLVTDDEVSEQINDLLETRIRPVAKDQEGDVAYLGFDPAHGRVHLEFSGGASGLLGGVQTMLRHYVPEVAEVVDQAQWIPKLGLDTDEGAGVQRVLDEQINPGVAGHGGHISLVDVADHTVYIRLEGGCQGCGMADVTLKQGVEVAIKNAVPSIVAVLDTTEHADGKNPYFQPGK
jgi:Fe-S cluster biogenesis protein NfuA